jgi:hypothetical protein
MYERESDFFVLSKTMACFDCSYVSFELMQTVCVETGGKCRRDTARDCFSVLSSGRRDLQQA